MVSFDAAEPGTAAAVWRLDARFADVAPLDITNLDHVVVVAAHPDDETLGAGALIAACAARGATVTVIVVTDGAASHPRSTTTTPDELRRLRASEARLAVYRLAPTATVITLSFADGAVEHSRAEIYSALVDALPAGTTTLVAPWRGDGHRDHRIVGEVCAEIAAKTASTLLEYPIWLWHWGTPGDPEVPWPRFLALDASAAAVAAKKNAIGAYGSQTQPLSDRPGDEPVLHAAFLENFAGSRELFVAETPSTLGAHYFDDLYARHDDPWGFTSRWYEQRKRAVTLASLPAERYDSALEVGCSIGVLTSELAARCDALRAVDVSRAAVDAARLRVADEPSVTVEIADVASDFPRGRYDLIVLSEVGYYFTADVLERVLDDAMDALTDTGTIVLCHWRHGVAEYALGGDEVHEIARARFGLAAQDSSAVGLTRLARHEEADFLLDVYSRDSRSVAARTGLV